tara:strand:+ start:106 stop:369 length:264 start_codon:yes stop_codon:yes gene_type:complete
MQKIFNGLALFSGIVSFSIVGGGVFLYLNAGSIIEGVKEKAVEEITEAIPEMISALMPEMPEVPELPAATGGVVTPLPQTTGGVVGF